MESSGLACTNYSISCETGVHLSVDAAVAHEDLEGAHVTPSVVPRVDAEPVVLAVLSAPADSLDGVASELGTGLVRVDTGLVGQEVLVDGEGRGDSSVGHDIVLDAVDARDAIAGVAEVLVVGVSAASIIRAG